MKLEKEAIKDPSISGLMIHIGWNEIEKKKGELDWKTLDPLIHAAETEKKWVQLLIFAGFYTPDWVFTEMDRGPIVTITNRPFKPQYGPLKHKDKDKALPLPMPWDPTYLRLWSEFLHKVGAKYDKSPSFVMIAAAGPTSVSVEMTLPQSPEDLKEWAIFGYTPDKYAAAWHSVFKACAKSFPHQHIALTVGDALDLDDRRKVVPGEGKRTRQKIVDQAITLLGSRFVLSNADLHVGAKQHEATEYVMGYTGRVLTGLEMRSALGKGPGAPGELKETINKGMQRNKAGQHISYLGIYEADVLEREMQPVLRYGASLFKEKEKHEKTKDEKKGRNDKK
ncbi:MAG: hypothetical protein WAN65_14615 [Candidatus Sulfotelmatobacter sp.]